MKKEKTKLWKKLLGIVVIIFILGIVVYLFPVLRDINTQEGQIAFRNRVNESGVLGLLWLFGIQLAQIFLVFVPGEPIEILAGMCYGPLWGTIFIMISASIISILIFLLVRKFGKNFVYQICNPERVKKIETSKFFQNPKKIEKILLILFLIPGTPKDFLAYVSGLLPIRIKQYILIATFARFPSVVSSTLAGAHIATGNWTDSILIYGITFLIIGILMAILNKFDKTKITEETLNVLKEEKL